MKIKIFRIIMSIEAAPCQKRGDRQHHSNRGGKGSSTSLSLLPHDLEWWCLPPPASFPFSSFGAVLCSLPTPFLLVLNCQTYFEIVDLYIFGREQEEGGRRREKWWEEKHHDAIGKKAPPPERTRRTSSTTPKEEGRESSTTANKEGKEATPRLPPPLEGVLRPPLGQGCRPSLLLMGGGACPSHPICVVPHLPPPFPLSLWVLGGAACSFGWCSIRRSVWLGYLSDIHCALTRQAWVRKRSSRGVAVRVRSSPSSSNHCRSALIAVSLCVSAHGASSDPTSTFIPVFPHLI